MQPWYGFIFRSLGQEKRIFLMGRCFMSQEERRNQTVWLDEQQRIASFHSVEGYHQRDFVCYDFFMSFLQSLQERGYRFQ